jgi:hypothetical protein
MEKWNNQCLKEEEEKIAQRDILTSETFFTS